MKTIATTRILWAACNPHSYLTLAVTCEETMEPNKNKIGCVKTVAVGIKQAMRTLVAIRTLRMRRWPHTYFYCGRTWQQSMKRDKIRTGCDTLVLEHSKRTMKSNAAIRIQQRTPISAFFWTHLGITIWPENDCATWKNNMFGKCIIYAITYIT